jgi:hypothetical protein
MEYIRNGGVFPDRAVRFGAHVLTASWWRIRLPSSLVIVDPSCVHT